jgi:MFS family permease
MTTRDPAAPTSGIPIATDGADGALVATPAPAAPPPPRRRRPTARELFVSFESRDFRYLALSSLTLGFGQWAQQIGLAWLTKELTGSATQIGGVLSTQGIISMVIAPAAGYLADRYPRRSVLIWTTVASAVQASVLAALALGGAMQLWQLYALALAGGAIQALTQPARQSFVYDVSTDETLVNAVAMNSLVNGFARIVAPPLTGVMIGFWGNGAPFVFLALTKVIAIVLTMQIGVRTRQTRIAGGRNAIGQVWEGFKVSWQDRRVLGLIIVHAIPTFLIIPYLPYLSVIAEDVHGKGATGFGFMNTMVGTGAVCGLFVLTLLGNPSRKGLLMLICFTLYAALLVIVAAAPSFEIALGALLFVGIINSIAFALNNTLIQLAAPNEVRGRVMSVWQITSGLQPLGSLPMGMLIDAQGVPIGMGSFMVTGMLVFIVFTLFWPSVRRM